jgi:hypothetical protein
MRLRLNKPLPRCWRKHPKAKGLKLLMEADVSLAKSRLKAKLLVFNSRKDMAAWWRTVLECPLSGNFGAAVSPLIQEHQKTNKDGSDGVRWMTADPRYFCVMGFIKKWLHTEYIVHESVHAGYVYAKRVKRSPWNAEAMGMDEELVCYPAGIIAARVNYILHKHALYED